METSTQWTEGIAAAMQDVQGTGVFAVQGDLTLPDPGLVVDTVGPVQTPIRVSDARRLIAVAKQAPFGRGTETVVDTAIRRCWELDPDRFRLTAEDWPDFERILAGGVAYELGFSEPLFKASLYKLLIYETDSFFLPHQDGEKLDGMVATLVVTLPGRFDGGELVIQHQDRTVACPASPKPVDALAGTPR